ncbi:MAG: DUF1592 domain-containing protein [Cyclobacteriaceae bacterium]
MSVQQPSSRSLLKIALSLTAVLILLVVIPFEGQSHWVLGIFGRFHPLLVHLPIGVLIALFTLEIINLYKPEYNLAMACKLLIWLAVITAIPTVLAGLLLASDGGYGSKAVTHQWLGWLTALLSIWLLVLHHTEIIVKKKHFSRIYHGALVVNMLLLSAAGHMGGTLTHGSDYLTELLPDEIKSILGNDRNERLAHLISQNAVYKLEDLQPVYHESVEPILSNSCYSCHGDEKQKGGLQLNTLDPDIINGKDGAKWRAALDMINLGEMPPEDEQPLSDQERKQLVEWLTSSLKYDIELKRSENRIVMRRLTRDQYTNSLNELLKVPVQFGDVLPEDAKSEMGFSNNGEVLQVSPLYLEYFQQIAREALTKAIGPEEKPAITRYKITFGKGIGKDKVAGMIGGYQSAPINKDDFVIDILDENGNPIKPSNSFPQSRIDQIKTDIGIGMRGSDADRYEVVEDGIILYSALPHKEVTPKSWQGPSPNLKLLMRKVFPENGEFVFRVKASRGYQLEKNIEGLISLRSDQPIEVTSNTHVFSAQECTDKKNLVLKGSTLVPEDVTQHSSAKFEFEAKEDGYYQVDFTHPYVTMDAMPSVGLRVDGFRIDERLHFTEEESKLKEITRPLTLLYLKKGTHKLDIGGKFFVGFRNVNVSYLPPDHPITKQLAEEAESDRKKYEREVPTIRVFAGTRTDDGMDYRTFGEIQTVPSAPGEFEEFIFRERLENLPIPEIDLNDTEILSNIMILGLWNNYLIKDNRNSGPPLMIHSIEFEAPYYEEWPSKSYKNIFFTSNNRNDQEVYTKEVISNFVERAFRRPVKSSELDVYMDFWKETKGNYPRYEDGVREVLVAVLCSPGFIYLQNPKEEKDLEFVLASRLSYFLWNSPPDETLMELAKKGKLKRNVEDQVERMIQDPKIWNMVRTFSNEWLRVDRQASMSTNVSAYPEYSRFVKEDMREETYHFIHKVLKDNMSIKNFINSDFAMLNQNLAEFYGIDGVSGNEFRPVKLENGAIRGGLLSQGAFLNGHSDGTQAHPIKRGVWLKAKILGDEPPPPPPNVPELDPETPGFDQMTLKEQLEVHRDKPSCMDCHKKIDPYGIVFENYNAAGLYQTMSIQKPIDSKVVLPDKTEVVGIEGIKHYLLEKKCDDFTTSLVKHLMAYALGRDISYADEEEINEIVDRVRSDDYKFQSVIKYIALSDSFLGSKIDMDEKVMALR